MQKSVSVLEYFYKTLKFKFFFDLITNHKKYVQDVFFLKESTFTSVLWPLETNLHLKRLQEIERVREKGAKKN